MKVMIVDDNAKMRGLVRSLLEPVASDFVECADGDEAVAAYPAEKPDWTVMDVTMARMDGIQATRLIRGRFPDSRIIIITQHANPGLRTCAKEAGAQAFVMKEDLIGLPDVILTRCG